MDEAFLEKCKFYGFYKTDVFIVQKGLFSSKIVFFSTICHHVLLNASTGAYKGLQGVTRGYEGLERLTAGYKWLQGVTESYKGL